MKRQTCPTTAHTRPAVKTFALAALALCALLAGRAAFAQEQRFEGQWLVDYRTDEGKTSLALHYQENKLASDGRRHRSNWNETRNVAPETLQGLTREQALSAAGAGVRFEIRRDAGTFVCEGWFRQGKGSGHFSFVPNQGFAAELSRRGAGAPDTRDLFRLAMADSGLALLEELRSAGYPQPTVAQLVRMGEHGVREEYVRGLKELGYRLAGVDSLVRMRDHGVTPDFIRGLRDAGFDRLPAETLVRTRNHGVTPSFIREIRAEGYESLSLEQFIRLRNHGVTAEFIRDLRDLGYSHLQLEQLVRLRNHGVTPDFIRRAQSRGGATPTVEELIRMRNSGSY